MNQCVRQKLYFIMIIFDALSFILIGICESTVEQTPNEEFKKKKTQCNHIVLDPISHFISNSQHASYTAQQLLAKKKRKKRKRDAARLLILWATKLPFCELNVS